MNALRRLAPIAALLAMVSLEAAGTDIDATFDKTFAFETVRTWAWHPDGTGNVQLAVSADDDPKKIHARIDPVIVPAVEKELRAVKLTKTDAATADVYVHYYALVAVKQAAQYSGQFLAPVPEWGVPPFVPQTSSLSIFPFGTLLVDLTSRATQAIVWRGSAARKLDFDKSDGERRKNLERAIHDLIRQFPPKK
jgi:hypothetical protein